MATEPQAQRVYRAACPNCGAPVEFRSAASASAVCSFCRSTLLREGDALRRIGQSAELFDDHSPLRLGAAGRYQGEAFSLVGRLQRAYADGTWNEWHALFDNGRSGWLSEDNGAYVFAFDAPLEGEVPAADELFAGEQRLVGGEIWSVASVVRARTVAAEGELPAPPRLDGEWAIADLRSTRDTVATLDYADPARVQWSVGRPVALSTLAMSGLADASEKTLAGRALECPNCGAALEPTLATTQSLVCGQCKSVVDISGGAGADLAFYRQAHPQGDEGPQIPLGRTGTLALGGAPLPWQVVGYVERAELPDDAEDERVLWREYLLYHRTEGFAFLVDAEDGWSWTRPITGVPEKAGQHVKLQGVQYKPLYNYTGIVTYVLGEFYWRLRRDERTANTDYQGLGADARKRLNRETTAGEVVWSGGESLNADVVAKAYGLAKPDVLTRAVTTPSSGMDFGRFGVIVIVLVVILVILLLARCTAGDDCDQVASTFGRNSNEYQQCARSGSGGGYIGSRTSGGSFGGFSTGGGHK